MAFGNPLDNSNPAIALQSVERVLTALRHCARAVVRCATEAELLQGVCRDLTGDGGYAFTWVVSRTPNGLRPEASAGPGAALARSSERWTEAVWAASPERAALDTGTVHHGSIGGGTSPWSAAARRAGLQEYIAVPFGGADSARVLAVFNDREGGFPTAETNLLGELAADLTDAVAALRRRQGLHQLADVLEHSSEPVGLLSSDGRLLSCNGAAVQVLGYTDAHELEGRPLGEWQPEWARRLVLSEGIPAALRSGHWMGETAILHRDGGEYPVSQLLLAERANLGQARLATILRERPGSTRPAVLTPLNKLPVHKREEILILDLAEVAYLRADGHYTRVFTANTDHLSTQSLAQLEPRLDPGRFLRVHRSYVVNVDYVSAIQRSDRQWRLVMADHQRQVVPVSRRNAEALRQALGLD